MARNTTRLQGGIEWRLLPRNSGLRTSRTPIEHLGVALKHEGTDLRILSRLFKQDIARDLADYVNANRFGVYTRRAWFLYEWMTGRRLAIEEPYGAQYVSAIDPTQYHARAPTRSPRHKIDNLPGVPGFCPLIRRTERLTPDRTAALVADSRAAVSGADPAVLRRAVGFMLLNESRGSFGIEGETPPRNRLERWGRIIAEARDIKLSISSLEDLQRSLFDPKQAFVTYGLRRIGGFVGRNGGRDQIPVPDHVSARPEDLPVLLAHLLQTYDLLKTHQFDPVLTAAILGFGFVFIHPFEDGNGRLHRFLLQKALADTGFNPEGVVLPVSAAILEDLLGYRAALEDYSAPPSPSSSGSQRPMAMSTSPTTPPTCIATSMQHARPSISPTASSAPSASRSRPNCSSCIGSMTRSDALPSWLTCRTAWLPCSSSSACRTAGACRPASARTSFRACRTSWQRRWNRQFRPAASRTPPPTRHPARLSCQPLGLKHHSAERVHAQQEK